MVCILLGNGFEESEAIVPIDLLRRAGVEVTLAGIGSTEITSSHNVVVKADCLVEDVDAAQVDLLFLPGGLGGVQAIQGSVAAMALVAEMYEKEKYLTAICAAPTVLGAQGYLKGRGAVCYPGMEDGLTGADVRYGSPFVVDGKVVTGEAAGSAFPFGLKLVELMKGRAAAEKVSEEVHYHGTF